MIERESLRDRLTALVEEMVDRGILCEDACLQFETHFLRTVLDRHNGNLSKAADELRLHRNTLAKRLKAAEVRSDRGKEAALEVEIAREAGRCTLEGAPPRIEPRPEWLTTRLRRRIAPRETTAPRAVDDTTSSSDRTT